MRSRFIVGGSSIDAIFKNFVASVDIATKFLDGQTQIKLLHFKNLQLKTPMATMAAYFPPNIVELVLINMFLSGFPAPIFKLRKLENLYVKMLATQPVSSCGVSVLMD